MGRPSNSFLTKGDISFGVNEGDIFYTLCWNDSYESFTIPEGSEVEVIQNLSNHEVKVRVRWVCSESIYDDLVDYDDYYYDNRHEAWEEAVYRTEILISEEATYCVDDLDLCFTGIPDPTVFLINESTPQTKKLNFFHKLSKLLKKKRG